MVDISKDRIGILGEYDLGIYFEAKEEQDRFPTGREYLAQKLTTYEQKKECTICGRPSQANNILYVTDTVNGSSLQMGLDCLGKYFKLGRSDIINYIGERINISIKVAALIGQGGFSNENEMILKLLEYARHIPHSNTLTEITKFLSGLLSKDTKSPDEHKLLTEYIEVILYIREFNSGPELFLERMMAMSDDPTWDRRNPQEMKYATELSRVKSLDDLNASTVKSIVDARRILSSRKPERNARFGGEVPWDYPNSEKYSDALERRLIARAISGDVTTILARESYAGNISIQRIADEMPVVMPIAVTRDGKHRIYWQDKLKDMNALSRELARQSGLDVRTIKYYKGEKVFPYRIAGKKYSSHSDIAGYKCYAFWRPMPWRKVYEVWYKYRGQGGRDFILQAPKF